MTNFTMLVHNRPRLTQQALRSLGDCSEMTVTVLGHNCDPETQYVVTESLQHLDTDSSVCFLWEQSGTGAARNRVIGDAEHYHGRGEFLYLSDNDVYFLRPDWLKILIANYEIGWKHGFCVLGAYNHPYHQHGARFSGAEGYEIAEVSALALQSMLMKWEVWDRYGPFKRTTPGMVCDNEDVEFAWRIAANGFRLGVIDPPLLVNCGITNSFGGKIPGWEIVQAQAPEGVIVA